MKFWKIEGETVLEFRIADIYLVSAERAIYQGNFQLQNAVSSDSGIQESVF